MPDSSRETPDAPSGEVTKLLGLVSTGDDSARGMLFDLLYAELRRLASSAMRAERPDHTLQPTALVGELYVRLAGSDSRFQNRAHFLAVAATAMRRVLIDHARVRRAGKRGGGQAPVAIDNLDALPFTPEPDGIDILALDDALVRLVALDERQGRIVELRFFGGLSVEETAAVVGVSERTVKREWQISRAWLRRELSRAATAGSPAI
jgi:RNA polymerase sigma factor (TIGR02999 family)